MKKVKNIVALLLVFSLVFCEFGDRSVKAGAKSDSEEKYIDWVDEEQPVEVDEDVLDSWEEEEEEWDDDEVYDDDGEWDDDEEVFDDTISVNLDIKERWENHYNAEITVTNLTDETIDNWAVAFDYGDEIEQIWNARIIAHKGNTYMIKCLDWNKDIAAQGSVSFGVTAKYADVTGKIINAYIPNDTDVANEDGYSVVYDQLVAITRYICLKIWVII